ncbi:ABC transporter ATP-binding protein [Halegenticoccus tardaugens]|uniref:ABC transporter ATP-binding protein n=1 Tax=Halegenticoccus tardaugens TaxID=2071624 RepID=UPI00100B06D6|nr:ABC transporter ATP-binding protein [Halegenticoccus tardaugens]
MTDRDDDPSVADRADEPPATARSDGRSTADRPDDPLLCVRGLKKHYPITEGVLRREVGRVRAVDGISFDVYPGETFGIVGESGCGKSTAATTLLGLEAPTDGEVLFDGVDVSAASKTERKRFRRRAQMIFQDPTTSFDPRMSVGESVAEPLRIHGMRDRDRRRRIAQNLLERVGLSADDVDRYPHEFSGGQKQRIGLARALVLNPDLIVADEPVSALDVSIQAEILALMRRLQEEFDLAVVFISHNLGVVREVCDRVAVMYLGEIVEVGPTERLFADPQHPYTRALLSSIPTPDPRKRGRGIELTGDVPSPSDPPSGCRFHTRCPEIVQPDGYEFEQTGWRRVMDLRAKLNRGEVDRESALELAAAHSAATGGAAATGGTGGTDAGAASDGTRATEASTREARAAIRRAFDLPAALTDERADAVLSEALGLIVDGDSGGAAALLADEFSTPCERREPRPTGVADGWSAACHLLDGSRRAEGAEPVTGRED